MSGSHAIQTALGVSGFFIRHLLALLVTVAVPCVLWTLVYLALLLWAIFMGGGIGGPLAYPAGILVIVVAATVSSLVMLLPSTVLAEWLAKRRGLPVIAQIPISVAVLAVLCFVSIVVAISVDAAPSFGAGAIGFGALFIGQLFPLGLYWWTAQSGPLLLSLWRLIGKKAEDG